jgi:outer membrane protein OmpA-like peptidoglycan-associated protein
MRVLLFFFGKNLPAAPGSCFASAPCLSRPARPAARLLTIAGLLALLAGAGCNTRPAETAPPAPPTAPTSPPPASAAKPDTSAAPADSSATAARAADSARFKPVAAKPAAPAKPKGPVLRDTIGNGKAARLLGGSLDLNTLRYRRDAGAPLMLKLARRTTLMVGVNSSESRLYRLFAGAPVPPALLARPLALDRLAFEPGQAVLGAEAAQQLGSLAALLHTFPKVQLRLSGHSAATEPQFWKLGNARGRVCMAELVKLGVAPSRLRTEWLPPQPKDPHPQGLSVRVVAR